MSVNLILGDCVEAMANLDVQSVDAVVTDPLAALRARLHG